MASNQGHSNGGSHGPGGSARRAPEWADGLKQLYDQVVEEDLPDSFRDLLDRLDAIDPDRGKPGAASGGRNTSQ